jgi:hypothetical protein
MVRRQPERESNSNRNPLRLYWKDRLIGEITDASWTDFPWVGGKIKLKRLAKEMRQVLNYVFEQSRSEDGLRDWPFVDELFWNWSILKPDGSREEIGIPIVDFADGSIEWR